MTTTPTAAPEPIAYAIYGRVTGTLKAVEILDEDEIAEHEIYYDVVPLYGPAALADVWDDGRDSLAQDMVRPLDDTGMRPVTKNPHRS